MTLAHVMEAPEPIVFVVDDDPSIRDALDSLFRSVGLNARYFASAQEFMRSPRPDVPSCLVLDVRMPGLSGLEFQRELAASRDGIPIIFVTGHGDIPMSVQAMKAGAIEFLTKPFRDQDLLDAIQTGFEKNRIHRQQSAAAGEIRRRYQGMTSREQETMALVVSGLLNKQIAAKLNISEITVKVRRGQIMRKMQAASFAELVRMAERLKASSQ
jgi:FixJ family two-component response regulator